MKSRFLFLVMFLGVALFSSCSDDDDEKAVTYKGENLSLLVGDFNFTGREAVLDGSSLTVKKALPGEAETVFAVTRTGSKIVGNNSNASRDVALEGGVDGDKLSLNLTVKMKSSMTAKWGVKSFIFNVETDQKEIVSGEEVGSVDEFVEQMGGLVNWILPNLLQSISLEEDGNVIASYIQDMDELFSDPKFGDSPKGMALYNVVDSKLYVALNINGIIADATSPKQANIGRSEVNPLMQLMVMAEEGLPLLMRKTDDGVDVYVNKEMMLPIVKMLPTLLETFGEQLGDFKETISTLVGILVPIIENSNETEIGLHLIPYVETPVSAASMVMPQAVEKMMLKFVK